MVVPKLSQSDTIYIGMMAVGLAGISIVIIAGALTNRKRGEWSRRGFMWHFLALATVWISILLNIIYRALYRRRNLHAFYLSPVAFGISAVADTAYFAVFIQLLSGYKNARDGKRHDAFRIVHYVLLSIILLLALVPFGWGIATGAAVGLNRTYWSKAVGGWIILFFLFCVDLLIFGVDFLRNGVGPRSHKRLLFGAIVVFFVRAFYRLIAAIVFQLVAISTSQAALASTVTTPMFNTWLLIIVSSLIVALGAKKTWVEFAEPLQKPMFGNQSSGAYAPGYVPELAGQNAYVPQGGYAPQAQWAGPWPNQQQFMPVHELSHGGPPAATELPTAYPTKDAVADVPNHTS